MRLVQNVWLGTVVLAVAMAAGGALMGAPRLDAFTVRGGGNTMLATGGSLGQANYAVSNPDAVAAEVTLVANPRGAESDGAVRYSRRFTVPPKSRVNGSFELTLAQARDYEGKLIWHSRSGDREAGHEVALLAKRQHEGGGSTSLSVFFGVVAQLGFGTDEKSPGSLRVGSEHARQVEADVAFTSFSSELPSRAVGYANLLGLFLWSADFASATPEQLGALRDYVRGGGCAIVCGRKPSFQLRRSVLADFLPVAVPDAPPHFLEDGNALRRLWGGKPRKYPLRNAFGEPLPGSEREYALAVAEALPEATVLAEMDGMPMIAMRRLGLGTVLWLAFDPLLLAEREVDLRPVLNNFFLRHCNFTPPDARRDAARELDGLRQQLLGYRIPPFRTLGWYLFCYVALGAACLVAGWKLRHPAVGWGAATVLALVLTGVILVHARRLTAGQPARSLSRVEVRVWDGAFGPAASYAYLVSREDSRATADGRLSQCFFLSDGPARPKDDKSVGHFEGMLLPLESAGRRIGIPGMRLQQNRPRPVAWKESTDDYGAQERPEALPAVAVTAEGALEWKEWAIPEALRPASRAMLVMPGAILPLANRADAVTGMDSSRVETDTVFVAARAYLEALELRTPALALVQVAAGAPPDKLAFKADGGEFSCYTYRMTLVPVRVEWPASGPVVIPPELTWFGVPRVSTLARVFRNGAIGEVSVENNAFLESALQVDFYPFVPAAAKAPAKVRFLPRLDTSSLEGDIVLKTGSADPVRRDAGTGAVEYEAAPGAAEPFADYNPLFRRIPLRAVYEARGAAPGGAQAAPTNEEAAVRNRQNAWSMRALNAAITFARP